MVTKSSRKIPNNKLFLLTNYLSAKSQTLTLMKLGRKEYDQNLKEMNLLYKLFGHLSLLAIKWF